MKTTKPNRPIRARYFPADHTDPIYWTAECLLTAPDAPPARIVEAFLAGDARSRLYHIEADGIVLFHAALTAPEYLKDSTDDPLGAPLSVATQGALIAKLLCGVSARRLLVKGLSLGRRDVGVHVHVEEAGR